MSFRERLKLLRILWNEAKGLERNGVITKAEDYPRVFDDNAKLADPNISVDPNGDGKAKVLPDMTPSELEDYQDELKGWGGFKKKIKDRIDRSLGK